MYYPNFIHNLLSQSPAQTCKTSWAPNGFVNNESTPSLCSLAILCPLREGRIPYFIKHKFIISSIDNKTVLLLFFSAFSSNRRHLNIKWPLSSNSIPPLTLILCRRVAALVISDIKHEFIHVGIIGHLNVLQSN